MTTKEEVEPTISDEALLCFAKWCRDNPGHGTNTEVLRLVFEAYCRVSKPQEVS